MRRGSGSALARAQSGLPTGNSGDGSSGAGGGQFAFNPAPSSTPAFSFSPSSSSTPPTTFAPPFSSTAPSFSFPSPASSASPYGPGAPSLFAPSTAPSSASASFAFPNPFPSAAPSSTSSAFPGFAPASSSAPSPAAVQIGPPSPSRGPPPSASPSHAGEQAWEPTFKRGPKEEDPLTSLLRSTTSILNKIGPRNYDSMVRELAEHVTGHCVHDGKKGVCGNGVRDRDQLFLFTRAIFEKALEEPNFSDIYALVCRDISTVCPKPEPDSTLEEFLSTLCNHELDEYLDHLDNEEGEDTEEEGDEGTEEDEEGAGAGAGEQKKQNQQSKLKRRIVGNLKFTAELFNSGLLSTVDLLQMCAPLIEQADTVELCCHLMRHAGRTLDLKTEDAIQRNKFEPPFYNSLEEAVNYQKFIANLYLALERWIESDQLTNRDLLEERDNDWEKVPPRAPQPAAAEPPRRPPITARRSLASKPPGSTAPQAGQAGSPPSSSFPSSPPTSRGAAAAESPSSASAWSSGAVAAPVRQPTVPPTSTSPPTSSAGAASAAGGGAGGAGGGAAGGGGASAMLQAKREQVRLIAESIVRPIKEAMRWADDNEQRMEAQGMRTQPRVEELNRAFLMKVSESLDRLHRQLGEVPFLVNLINFIGAYAKDTLKEGGDRGPYDPKNIVRLKTSLIRQIAKVEQAFGGSSATASSSALPSSSSSSAESSSTALGEGGPQQASPLASGAPRSPAIPRTAGGGAAEPGPAMSTGFAPQPPQHASGPAARRIEELPPDWMDPDLHKLTRGLPLDKVLSGWEEELAARATSLHRSAQFVAALDKACIGLDHSMAELSSSLNQVAIVQTEVDKGLDVIHRHQLSFAILLDDLERQARSAFTEGDADLQREKGYETAKQVGEGLHDVERDLGSMVAAFNDGLTQQRATQEKKVVELEEILNNSLNALQWMSATSSRLERKLRHLQRIEPVSS